MLKCLIIHIMYNYMYYMYYMYYTYVLYDYMYDALPIVIILLLLNLL